MYEVRSRVNLLLFDDESDDEKNEIDVGRIEVDFIS